jgi:glycosyltransferase involved in cell wall biosynthesis
VKIALTCDWLNQYGGAERVLGELHGMFPDAPIFTAVHDPERLPGHTRSWDIRPSFLQRIPLARKRHQPFLPLMPLAFEQFDLSGYDMVLSTSHACAKGVIVPTDAVHICYCYTPCRYIWDLYHEYTRDRRLRALIAPVAHWLRMWDQLSSQRVDHFVAISHEVAARIRRHYRRNADVIYPPVEVDRFAPNGRAPEDFDLVVSRLVPYKRIDLAIGAANRLRRRLVIVGDGPDRRRLAALAGRTVEFMGMLPDEEVAKLYGRCRAFLFPGFEDFGIAPVEAQAAGRPVIAFGRGGATETVVHGATGVLFEEQTVDALIAAIEAFDAMDFDPALCRRNAERFDRSEFCLRLATTIQQQVQRTRETAGGAALHSERADRMTYGVST